jgi:hypothetical protein
MNSGYDLDDGQMTLLGYARFYDSINQMLPSDRPDDDVINDDSALDRWYQGYIREQAIKSGKKSQPSNMVQIPQFQPKE